MSARLTSRKKIWLPFILAAALTALLTLTWDAPQVWAGADQDPAAAVKSTPAAASLYLPLILTQPPIPQPVINVPYLGAEPADPDAFEPAIFWLGQVTSSLNSADVRLWHYDQKLKIVLHIIDRQLWYDETPSPASLEDWDAVTLLLDLQGGAEDSPGASTYRFISQLGNSPADRAAYQGNGAGWSAIPIPFTAETTWRGSTGPNSGADAKGWQLTWEIPFSELGLPARPSAGTEWRLAVLLHDRDEAAGSPAIPDQTWPRDAQASVPAGWGRMRFGLPAYNQPPGAAQGSTTIRNGLDGVHVVDGHVGGHTICGADLANHWEAWGEANYAGYSQINIQNQWDISDYPCFSKYYITFPLDAIPAGKTIHEANLSMFLFGNAGGGEWGPPPDSFIQVATVAEDWDEGTLNWNNAPRLLENYGGTWVQPVQDAGQGAYYWDVSRALAAAYQAGQPLRLALYSIDGERHSGKYFWSADISGEKSPTLHITWGE
ncbi:MAG: DNRLRE domain-containing protein [Candidatus Promineifilaceae bacterium]|jgi:hypothetical protein